MKIILCIGLIALCGYIGFSISKHYIERKKFYFNFLNFLNELKTDINFSAKKLDNILNQVNFQCKQFFVLLNNYRNCLYMDTQIDKAVLFKDINILSEQEKESTYDFFKSLGKLDVFNQVSSIDNFIKTTHEYYKIAQEDSKKYRSLYTKLGIIIGTFVALIIM